MSKQRKFVLIAAAVGVVSMFLPWLTAPSITVFGVTQGGGWINGMHNSGILVFLCFAASAAFTLMGDQTKNLDKTFWMITLAAGALAALIVVWNIIDMSGKLYGASFGFGIYIAAVAAAGVVAAAFMYKAPLSSPQI